MVQKCLKDLVRVSNEARSRVTISYTHQSRFCGVEIPWPIRDYRKVLVTICRVYVRVQACCQSKGVLSGARARRNSFIVASYYLVQC